MRSVVVTASTADASAEIVRFAANAPIRVAVARSSVMSAKSSENGWPSYLTIRWRGRDIGGVRAIVEACFAELRELQGLKRFHRRGLKAVRRVHAPLHSPQSEASWWSACCCR